jgi:methionyl-tRNA formyltransferase
MQQSIPLYVVKSQREADAVLNELQPTRCLVVGWYWIIASHILNKVSGGFIGIHNSLLPRYRGCAPLVWALIRGEERVGISMFSFSEGMDDGPVWGQREVLVSKSDTIGTVLARLEREAVELIAAVWPQIEKGTILPAAQAETEATYCGLRTPEDGRIDWCKSYSSSIGALPGRMDDNGGWADDKNLVVSAPHGEIFRNPRAGPAACGRGNCGELWAEYRIAG